MFQNSKTTTTQLLFYYWCLVLLANSALNFDHYSVGIQQLTTASTMLFAAEKDDPLFESIKKSYQVILLLRLERLQQLFRSHRWGDVSSCHFYLQVCTLLNNIFVTFDQINGQPFENFPQTLLLLFKSLLK